MTTPIPQNYPQGLIKITQLKTRSTAPPTFSTVSLGGFLGILLAILPREQAGDTRPQPEYSQNDVVGELVMMEPKL